MIQGQHVPGSQGHPVATPLMRKPKMGRKCGKWGMADRRNRSGWYREELFSEPLKSGLCRQEVAVDRWNCRRRPSSSHRQATCVLWPSRSLVRS